MTGASGEAGPRNEEAEDGFVVFHEEFSRVEAPYAVGLWIIVVALIKIGEQQILEISSVKLISKFI